MKWRQRRRSVCCKLLLMFALLPTIYTFVALQRSQKRASLHPLNGIRGFRSWLESTHPDAIYPIRQLQDQDNFDHVLIDLNQFLHVIVRNSRSDDHALVLLMKELDLLIQMATPTKSLVLAIDGPPSAAKLATQRQRRLEKIIKVERTLKQLKQSPLRVARRKRSIVADTRVLALTPSTNFMKSVEKALLYWTWQRLSNRNSCLPEGVHVYISPSSVPGEGEVKLLEWLYRHTSRPHQINESVAFLGGDADLVVEGLMLNRPNVFCLLPHVKRQFSCVSVWQLTRDLARKAGVRSVDELPQRRLDWVLLILLNGNDYVNKLRGSSGFNRVMKAYSKVLRRHPNGGLVDIESLDFQLDFCIEFFQEISHNLIPFGEPDIPYSTNSFLSKLYQYAAVGYLPQPVTFEIKSDFIDENNGLNTKKEDDEEAFDYESFSELNDDDDVSKSGFDLGYDESDENDTTGNKIELVLQLGDPDSDDFYEFSAWVPIGHCLKGAKQRLASIALRELLDTDEVESGLDDMKVRGKVIECDVPLYLYGLLWTLQTYQDGTCADYGFQYGGRRLSPSAKDLVEYFVQAKAAGRSVGISSLRKGFTQPATAGIACLAALPLQAKDHIAEPYKFLDDEFVEFTYQSCVNETSLTFDMELFSQLCNDEVKKRAMSDDRFHFSEPKAHSANSIGKGRRIIMGDHSWTVLTKKDKSLVHPFQPPEPFLDRLSELWHNNYIQAQKIKAASSPRPRSVWNETTTQDHLSVASMHHTMDHCERKVVPCMNLLGKDTLVEDVIHVEAYRMSLKTAKTMKNSRISRKENPPKIKDATTHFSLRDGVTASACLKQLEDARYVGKIEWSTKSSSHNNALSEERWTLVINKGGCLIDNAVFQRVREPTMTKQFVKQELSSQALTHILRKANWANLSYQEVRSLVKAQMSVTE
ncbi:5'-3' exoribonuclease 1 [Fistulifera solaris]|uniref:5'-3' exoribonuclease 1 n=1 Tax=Fistulifera solaris TaxID=1519565 RepID=A0A1Z5KRK4_FISSO|nr:5'-3' exoribonuclease 1 [Fistulifera solaris]|eukprot:GAX28548.1 5'-3' exoribonuclease 1 [Fistulifera solaris]